MQTTLLASKEIHLDKKNWRCTDSKENCSYVNGDLTVTL